jgi:hypothetical protein
MKRVVCLNILQMPGEQSAIPKASALGTIGTTRVPWTQILRTMVTQMGWRRRQGWYRERWRCPSSAMVSSEMNRPDGGSTNFTHNSHLNGRKTLKCNSFSLPLLCLQDDYSGVRSLGLHRTAWQSGKSPASPVSWVSFYWVHPISQ